MKILRTLCALAAIMFFPPTSALALTVLPMDLKGLTERAELIFVGTAIDIRSAKRDTIYTYVTFSDLRIVKGTSLESTIDVRLTGGTVAGESLEVPGMPQFVVGERDLIFLAGNFQYICPIVGWGQGRFKIKRSETSGQEAVFDGAGVRVTGIRGNKVMRPRIFVNPKNSSPGVPDTGEVITRQSQELQTRKSQTAIPLTRFISGIERVMGIRQQD